MPREEKKQTEEKKPILEWEALEFIQHKKSKAWFSVLWLAGAAIFVFAVLSKNYLFALIVFLATFLIYVQSIKRPKKVLFKITAEGICADEKLFHFEDIKSFWIFEEPEIKSLSIITKKIANPQISIPFGDLKPELIKKILAQFIPEKKHKEDLTDIVARKLKF